MCVKESNLISVTPRVLASSIRMRIISCAMPFRLKFLRTLTFIKWTRLPSRCRAHLRPRRVRVHRAGNRKVPLFPPAVFLLRLGEGLASFCGGLSFNPRADCDNHASCGAGVAEEKGKGGTLKGNPSHHLAARDSAHGGF